jgi:hypothetical protein
MLIEVILDVLVAAFTKVLNVTFKELMELLEDVKFIFTCYAVILHWVTVI